MTSPRLAIITPVRGRLDHLTNQRRFLDAVVPGVEHIIVAVEMPGLDEELAARGVKNDSVVIVDVPDDPRGMPTALARNAGATRALADDADLLVFLDVDCIPLAGFVPALVEALRDVGSTAVLNGIVTYLPESARLDDETAETAARHVAPHPVRPSPDAGEVTLDDAHHLLWSLAFAVTPEAWRRIGGFDERYVGYGAEDTDFGRRARDVDLRMAWVGGAQVLHQWHPSANPPVHHLEDIVRNATLYFARWGEWPMEGWLRAFADAGLVEWTPTSLRLRGRD